MMHTAKNFKISLGMRQLFSCKNIQIKRKYRNGNCMRRRKLESSWFGLDLKNIETCFVYSKHINFLLITCSNHFFRNFSYKILVKQQWNYGVCRLIGISADVRVKNNIIKHTNQFGVTINCRKKKTE